MAQRFFDECTTIEEVKNRFRELAKMYHPDKQGGDLVQMQIINAEYDTVIKRMLKGENLTDEETENEIKYNEQYREAIEKIIMLPNIIIELVGKWIWVSGETFPVRAELKAAGYEFSGSKKNWYFRTEEHRHYNKTGKTLEMDEIRSKYGSETVKKGNSKRKKVASNVQ